MGDPRNVGELRRSADESTWRARMSLSWSVSPEDAIDCACGLNLADPKVCIQNHPTAEKTGANSFVRVSQKVREAGSGYKVTKRRDLGQRRSGHVQVCRLRKQCQPSRPLEGDALRVGAFLRLALEVARG